MGSSVLTLAQSAMGELALNEPASIVSTGQEETHLKRLLYAAARELRNLQIFPQQKKLATVTTSAARSKYPYPSDFYAFCGNTGWDSTSILPLNGPISDEDFTRLTYQTQLSGPPFYYRPFGPDFDPASSTGQLELIPTPGGVYSLKFDYFINTLFLKADYTVRGETITLDTDLCIFDDDVMIASIKYRYLESKNQPFESHKAAYDDLIESAISRWRGAVKGNFARSNNMPRYSVPRGGWPF
jgi:hypothetical protein